MSETKIGYKDILKQKEYMKMILAALINRFGDSIDAIASTWIVYELTGSAVWSAVIYGVNKLPTVFITPLAGAWVEGRNKKRIMIFTDLIRAVCVACVATCYLLHILQPWILVATTFIISTVEAFRGPASMAFTPKILAKEYYSYGMSLMSTLSSVVELVGTAAAAGIIAVIGVSGAIYIDMVTFLLSALIILFVNGKEQNLQKQKLAIRKCTIDFVDGLKYVKNDKIVCFFMGLALFLNGVLVPLNSLEAPLVSEVLHGGAEVLSILGISATVGMLLGSALYPKIDGKVKGKVILFIAGSGIGVYYAGLIACQPLYGNELFMHVFVAVTTSLLGFFIAVCSSFMNVEFMKRVDEKYLARAAALMTSLGCMAMPFVSFVISAFVAHMSTATVFVIAGLLDIVICIFIVRSHVLDDEKEVETVEEQESIAM